MQIGSIADWAERQKISRVAAYKRIAQHNIPWVTKGKIDLDEADRIWAEAMNPAKQRGGIEGGLAAQDAAQARLFGSGADEDDDAETPQLPFPAPNGHGGMGGTEVRQALGRAQLQRELYRIRREKLTVEEMEGKLVPLLDVRAFFAESYAAAKGEILVIGSETCDELATISDPVKIRAIIDDRANKALSWLREWKPKE